MKEQTKRAIVFGMVLMLAIPAAQISAESEALAGPFDTLSGSRSSGKRSHKQKDKKDKKEASRKKSSSSSSRSSSPSRRTTTRTTSRPSSRSTSTSRRRVDDRRTVRCTASGRCDGDPSPRRTTTTTRTSARPVSRTTTTTRVAPRRGVTTRTTRVSSRPVYRRTTSRTEVHHYHGSSRRSTNTRYYGSSRSGGSVSTRSSGNDDGGSVRNPRELYVTGGMGLSALAANQVADGALPGLDFTLGVGAKRGLLVGEVGFGLAGYRLDPEMAVNTADMTVGSITGDLKLQPRLSFIEPYVSAGLGGHIFNDHVIDEGAAGASLRLGAGVDLRFDTVAISAQYQRSFMALAGDSQIYEDGAMSASTETLGLGLKIYF